MDTAHKTEEEKKEYFDSPEILDQKCKLLADLIRTSEHFIAFTGAGISTSTGIRDFRSGINTVLKTGPGCWEKQAQNIKNSKDVVTVSTLKAIPSDTHMSLIQLENYGLLKFIISQNTDGLHRRSGFPPERMAELHGNTNMEKCIKCKKCYMRDFHTRNAQKVHEHQTGRKCDDQSCSGELYDTIINFGENLPEKDMDDGFLHSQLADLCLVLGSSLRVTPAADMPRIVGKAKKNLVIVNLQLTPLDNLCSIRIFAKCDDVMVRVMKNLEIDIPDFILQRRIKVLQNENKVRIQGQDIDGSPYQILKSVTFFQGKNKGQCTKSEPFEIKLVSVNNKQQQQQQNKIYKQNQEQQQQQLLIEEQKQIKDQNIENFKAELQFFGNYNETNFSFNFDELNLQNKKEKVYLLEFSPKLQQWINFQEEK